MTTKKTNINDMNTLEIAYVLVKRHLVFLLILTNFLTATTWIVKG